jgi:hypothetical protein
MPFTSTYSNNIVQSETVTRITAMTVGNIPTFDANGKLIDSGIPIPSSLNFTEFYTMLTTPPSAVWTLTTVTGAPINSIVEIEMQVNANANRQMGVRKVGSTLNRLCGVNGSNNSCTMLVKTNNVGQIETYTSVNANSEFVLIGVLN